MKIRKVTTFDWCSRMADSFNTHAGNQDWELEKSRPLSDVCVKLKVSIWQTFDKLLNSINTIEWVFNSLEITSIDYHF